MSEESVIECSLVNISKAISKCDFAIKYCNSEELIKFTQFYYCDLNESVPILIILTILITLVAFHLLSSTAENYLSPALAKISDSLKCSQTLAGVTLLALGNGAPDVFTAIIAGGGSDNEGINLAIGSIFGAGLFVTTITLAKVIKSADEIKQCNIKNIFNQQADKNTLLRDVGFYTLATFLMLIYTIIGYVNFTMAIIFFSVYFVYNLRMEQQKKEKQIYQKNITKIQTNYQQYLQKEFCLDTSILEDDSELQNRNLSIGSGIDSEEYISDNEGYDFDKSYKASQIYYFGK